MNQTNPTRTRPYRDADVTPSAPGSVDAWLDMLVSMLALPKHERERVRDELEDHLRSRIDDLIITGLTEPEALQKAASELGETADLARQISHAHGPNRKRTYAMHAALIALAGSITAVGISLSGGGSNPNTVNGIPVISDVPVVGMAVAGEQPHDHDARVSLRDTTLEAVIKAATALADRPVLVHWDVLADAGIERDHPIDFDVDPLPHHLVHDLLTEYFEREIPGDTLAAYTSEDLYEISTRSHFDQRSKERVMYSLDGVIPKNPVAFAGGNVPIGADDDAIQMVVDIIQHHIDVNGWVALGGATSSVTAIDRTLIITAPERVHLEIEPLLKELRQRREARSESIRHDREELAHRIRAEYQELRQQRTRLTIDENQRNVRDYNAVQSDESSTEEDKYEANQLFSIRAQQISFEIEEIDARLQFMRDKLIQADYAWITDALPNSGIGRAGGGGQAPF